MKGPWVRVGYGCLAPIAFAFGMRDAARLLGYAADGTGFSVAFRIFGPLSLAGLIVLLLATWKNRLAWPWVAAGIVTVLIGHPVATGQDGALGEVGAALVFVGMGLAGRTGDRRTLPAGFLAAIGALLRILDDDVGHLGVAVGALVLGGILAWTAYKGPARGTPAGPEPQMV